MGKEVGLGDRVVYLLGQGEFRGMRGKVMKAGKKSFVVMCDNGETLQDFKGAFVACEDGTHVVAGKRGPHGRG